MSENKNLKYGVIAGAAIVGAAAIWYLMNGKSSDAATSGEVDHEDAMDQDLEAIGEIEIEDGHIKFEQFLKIFEICSFYGKTQFQVEKKSFIAQRRQALKDGDEEQYTRLVDEMTKKEESLVQEKLMSIIEKLGISE